MVAYFCPLHASYFSTDYVKMQDTYISMHDKYVNMQDGYDNMQDKKIIVDAHVGMIYCCFRLILCIFLLYFTLWCSSGASLHILSKYNIFPI